MSGGAVQWSPGLLLIDGKPVGACSFDADMARLDRVDDNGNMTLSHEEPLP